MTMRISSIYRYPVKGLSPERLTSARLEAGRYFPGDRIFAIENGPSGFDPDDPQFQPKQKFLVLMRDQTLARLETRYLDESGEFVVALEGRERLRVDLRTREGRAELERFMADFMQESGLGENLAGAPRLLHAPEGFRFTDSPAGYVSIINLASVAAVEELVGAPVDPLRFRGNIHVEGLSSWSEFDLVGRELVAPYGLRLKVTARIRRCAATNVDPRTGERDLSIPKTLMQQLGHMDCGVYAQVLDSGSIAEGGRLEPVETDTPATLFR
jgi:uncharacterized protein